MKSIKVTILGKPYPLRVEDNDEELMHQIAQFVDDRFRVFRDELSNQQEVTVLVLACLSIAEELFLEKRGKSTKRESDSVVIDDASRRIRQIIADIQSDFSHIEPRP
jgi:cell division protein ZapA